MAKTTIVTTTIYLPNFIAGVCENITSYKHQDVDWLIIGDTKTPPETRGLCNSVSSQFGIPVKYLDLDDQKKALADFPALANLIPEKTPVRKLIGNFLAYLDGAEAVIMLDDDNLATEADIVGAHNIVTKMPELTLVKTDTGWFNVYEAFKVDRDIPIYPRGFAWQGRKKIPTEKIKEKKIAKVALNNGFVLEDPDIDAISRLFWPIRTLGIREEWGSVFGLAPGTWSSSNNQNTAIRREVIPVYYTPVATGRNSDIWTSYVICRLAEHMNEAITFGAPLVRQPRNPHDLWKDLDDELLNNRATDAFVDLLRAVPLESSSYIDALEELLSGALARLESAPDPRPDIHKMMKDFFLEYQLWHRIFSKVIAQELTS